MNPGHRGDFILVNNLDALPAAPPAAMADYHFQIIHIPLRTILGNAFFRLPDDVRSHEKFFEQTEEFLARYLDNVLQFNTDHKLLSFVLGFLIPQQNPLGRFQPRYDLRNIAHFIERLNMSLTTHLASRENAYFVDMDQISSGIGKKHCQDDMVWSFTHGTTLSDGDHDHDLGRIEPVTSMQTHYAVKWVEFFKAVMHEIFAMVRTIGQHDAVKLVAVDLDDTLWRGVAAEGTLGILEGWPMGFMETLLLLKKRGILLVILSKNDENFIVSQWETIVQGRIALTDFAAYRINFRSKAENLAEMLKLLNIRPENTVFVDDNPVERAAMHEALPAVRVLGGEVYYTKRILLWAAETQARTLSDESTRRTEMMRGQLQRESARSAVSHEEFLATLQLRVSVGRVRGTSDLTMSRALELFNKTNQFNTTGVRYSLEDCHRRFLAGHELYVWHAADRFTQYGLIGAAWVHGRRIEHLVMSCRALGLGIEDCFLAFLAQRVIDSGRGQIEGILHATNTNAACHALFSAAGFVQVEGNPALWLRELLSAQRVPAHVELSVDA